MTGHRTSYVTGQKPTELLQKHKISDVTSVGYRLGEVASPGLTDFYWTFNPIPHGVFWITNTWGGQNLPAPW